jgi:hypothetical protein
MNPEAYSYAGGVQMRGSPPRSPVPVPVPVPQSCVDMSIMQHLASFEAPPDFAQRDEFERMRLEACLRQRRMFHMCHVVIFGSSGTGLCLGNKSDVDMCIMLPSHEEKMAVAKLELRHAEASVAQLEAAHPKLVVLIDSLEAAQGAARVAARDLDFQLKRLTRLTEQKDQLNVLHQADLKEICGGAPAAAGSEPVEQLAEAVASMGVVNAGAPADAEAQPTAAIAEAPSEEVGGGGKQRGVNQQGVKPYKRKPKQTRDDVPKSLQDVEKAIADCTAKTVTLRTELREAEARARQLTNELQAGDPDGETDGAPASPNAGRPQNAAGLAAGRIRQARQSVIAAEDDVVHEKKIVYPLAQVLQSMGYSHLQPVARARVGVVKCVSPSGVPIDCVVNNGLAAYNTALIRTYAHAFPIFRSLALLVKAWAAARGLSNAKIGAFSL